MTETDLAAEVTRLRKALYKAHDYSATFYCGTGTMKRTCRACNTDWPCKTVRELQATAPVGGSGHNNGDQP